MDELVVATNRQAYHDYAIEEKLEAGLQLTGAEVKSLRQRQANLQGSFARVEGAEPFLYNMHIRSYDPASYTNVDPMRRRKLLLHRKEIERLIGLTAQRGRTLIPLRCYFSHGLAKIELGVGKGKREYDKREAIRRKEARREIDRAIRRRTKQ